MHTNKKQYCINEVWDFDFINDNEQIEELEIDILYGEKIPLNLFLKLQHLSFLYIRSAPNLEKLEIPDEYNYNLKEISISNSKITQVPETINYLVNLEHLSITDSKVQNLNIALALTKIISINFENNIISSISINFLKSCRKIYKITLTNNRLDYYNIDFENNPHLSYLSIDRNNITKIDVVGKKTRMSLINISNNRLNILPCELKNVQEIKVIRLDNNPIESCSSLENCSFNSLSVSNTKLEDNNIKKLCIENAGYFDISYTKIESIECLLRCNKLETLMISGLSLSYIPKSVILNNPLRRIVAFDNYFDPSYLEDLKILLNMNKIKFNS